VFDYPAIQTVMSSFYENPAKKNSRSELRIGIFIDQREHFSFFPAIKRSWSY
jgi:hypothetical protein